MWCGVCELKLVMVDTYRKTDPYGGGVACLGSLSRLQPFHIQENHHGKLKWKVTKYEWFQNFHKLINIASDNHGLSQANIVLIIHKTYLVHQIVKMTHFRRQYVFKWMNSNKNVQQAIWVKWRIITLQTLIRSIITRKSCAARSASRWYRPWRVWWRRP